ncbi:hypothetical protein BKK51_11225 [Rodentibacter trehalosifermentans]|uniref:Glycosyltransferase n=1 Tax=Rodentibacter trehalosifermentans TaxID=1908263 RepID=A0A1V3IN78_9PAST|nr:hypothetical protein [Rodentibacter trehalosifermentans]OOF43715.1 hypothetical protein BKK51_11225 [Rodentibacter trehalosifermentans]
MNKIVHLSNTPLVGAPGKISYMSCLNGYDSISIVFSDYPEKGKLSNKFLNHSILWSNQDLFLKNHLINKVENADIIHIHNHINPEHLNYFNFNLEHQKFIYHVHSPLREGPLFDEKSEQFDFKFNRKLVVAQYHPRFFNDFIPVPNLVLELPQLNLKKDDEKLRVMYSPTHNRGGRWNTKYTEELESAMQMLQKMKLLDIVSPSQPLSPHVLLEIRRSCHVTIDEIATGSYHQVSLEGLCCGNVVINNADIFSKMMLSNVANSSALPPFLSSSGYDITEKLFELTRNNELVRLHQKRSFEFYTKHLMPNNLFSIYNKIYKELLNENEENS